MSATVRNKSVVIVELRKIRPPLENSEPQTTALEFAYQLTPSTSRGYSGIAEHSTPLHSLLEHTMLFLFPMLLSLNLYFALARLYELELLWLGALAVPLGLVWGDFVTGSIHWVGDTYFSEDTPIIGPGFVKPFRLHHVYPRDICTHNLVTTLGNSCTVAVPALSLCLYLVWGDSVSSGLAFGILSVTMLAVTTVATNQFHKWAHQERLSPAVRLLQRMRLVLEPAHHQLHHDEPHDRHYCITNGWLNPFLNKIKFFRGLEASLRFLGIETARS